MKIYFCSVHSSHQVFRQKYIFKEFICNDDTIMFWNTAEIQLQCTLFLINPLEKRKCLTVLREKESVNIHTILNCVLVTICDLVWFSF